MSKQNLGNDLSDEHKDDFEMSDEEYEFYKARARNANLVMIVIVIIVLVVILFMAWAILNSWRYI